MNSIHEITRGDRGLIDTARAGPVEFYVSDIDLRLLGVHFKPVTPGPNVPADVYLSYSLIKSQVVWTFQYQKTQLQPRTGYQAPTWTPGLGAPLTPYGEALAREEELARQLKSICPVCRGETELKTFSSFSYTYCPKCKEDVAVLAKAKPPHDIAKTVNKPARDAGYCDCGCGLTYDELVAMPAKDNIPF